MDKKKKLVLLIAAIALLLIAAVTVGIVLLSGGEDIAQAELPYNYDYTNDADYPHSPDITIDGSLDEAVWQNVGWYRNTSYSNVDSTMSVFYVSTTMDEYGIYIAGRADDKYISTYSVTPTAWWFYISAAEKGSEGHSVVHRLICDLSGKTQRTMVNAQWDFQVQGEPNSGKSEGATLEAFISWKALGVDVSDGLPEYFGMEMKYDAVQSSGNTIGTYSSICNEYNITSRFFRFNENGYINADAEDAIIGDTTFGLGKSAGWDLTNIENGSIECIGDVHNRIYFKEYGRNFLIETTIIPIEALGTEPWPRAGILFQDAGGVYHAALMDTYDGILVDGLNGTKNMGNCHIITISNNDGGWNQQGPKGGYQENPLATTTEGTKLTVLKDGGKIYYFVNDVFFYAEYLEYMDTEMIPGLMTIGDHCIFKDYSCKAVDRDEINSYLAERKVHNITVSAGAGGTIEASEIFAKDGGSYSLTITCKSGYTVSSLLINGVEMIDDARKNAVNGVYTVKNVTCEQIVQVKFEKTDESTISGSFIFDKDAAGTNVLVVVNGLTNPLLHYEIAANPAKGYSVTLPSGKYHVSITKEDYMYTAKTVTVDGEATADFELKPSAFKWYPKVNGVQLQSHLGAWDMTGEEDGVIRSSLALNGKQAPLFFKGTGTDFIAKATIRYTTNFVDGVEYQPDLFGGFVFQDGYSQAMALAHDTGIFTGNWETGFINGLTDYPMLTYPNKITADLVVAKCGNEVHVYLGGVECYETTWDELTYGNIPADREICVGLYNIMDKTSDIEYTDYSVTFGTDEARAYIDGFKEEWKTVYSLSELNGRTGLFRLGCDIKANTTTVKNFAGYLDGNGHTVNTSMPLFETMNGITLTNLNVNLTKSLTAQGVIAAQGSDVTLKNVHLTANSGVVLTAPAGKHVGAFIGQIVTGTGSDFINCSNSIPVVSTQEGCATGGMVGFVEEWHTTFSGCVNNATVTGVYQVGGIAGACNKYAVTFDKCINNGIINSAQDGGGILGFTMWADEEKILLLQNCINNGTVNAQTAGGILGSVSDGYAKMLTCVNNGAVNGVGEGNRAGGILGTAANNGWPIIIGCSSTTNATVSANDAGGIMGSAAGVGSIVLDGNINRSDVCGEDHAGGILGYGIGQGKEFSLGTYNGNGNTNYGHITGGSGEQPWAGGIVGGAFETVFVVDDAVNYGTVDNAAVSGGIVGFIYYGEFTMNDCVNFGSVYGTANFGGLYGAAVGMTPTINNSAASQKALPVSSLSELEGKSGNYYLTGDVTDNTYTIQAFSGTLDGAGYTVSTTVPLFEALDRATVKDLVIRVDEELTAQGALAASASSTTVSNVSVIGSGKLIAPEGKNVGGLVGEAGETEFVSCSNAVEVVGTSDGYAGGIVGAVHSTDVILTDCSNSSTVTANIVGGILGGANKYNIYINGCSNSGTVTATNAAGGILGETIWAVEGDGVVIGASAAGDTLNSGTVTAQYAGGVIGCVNNGSIVTVDGVTNSGTIAGNNIGDDRAAGIIGYIHSNGALPINVTNCVNDGTITAKIPGGIIAQSADASTTVKNCINNGDVTTYNALGAAGILGRADGTSGSATVIGNTNNAVITGNISTTGQITGLLVTADGMTATVADNIENGSVNGSVWDGYCQSNAANHHEEYMAYGTDGVTTIVVGDSFFDKAFWTTFEQDFEGKDALCLGIGGSTAEDWLYYISTRTFLYDIQPKNVVFNLGNNDLHNGEFSVEQYAANMQKLLNTVHTSAPDANLYMFSVAPRTGATGTNALAEQANAVMKAWCESQGSWVTFVDISDELNEGMLGDGIHPYVNYYAEIFVPNLLEAGCVLEDKDEGNVKEAVGISSLDQITEQFGSYYLTGDITANTVTIENFGGTLDGKGYTVTTSVPLFDVFNLGKLTDLNIVLDTDLTAQGVVANTASNATLTNVSVSGSGKLTAPEGKHAGGLIGEAGNTKFTSCSNAIDVVGRSDCYAGGIIGAVTSTEVTLTDCSNSGNISAHTAGGIMGEANKFNIYFYGCSNSGTVTASVAAGGILGETIWAGQSNGVIIADSGNGSNVNTGSITALYAGGIIGCLNNGTILNLSGACNSGVITGNGAGDDRAGGIIGYIHSNGELPITITDCVNDGAATAKYTGGIVGQSAGCVISIDSCVNNGFVKSSVNGGGIMGRADGTGSVTLTACTNNGAVNVLPTYYEDRRGGGMIGHLEGPLTVLDGCVNTGTIYGPIIGGLVGQSANTDLTVTACLNEGPVAGAWYRFAGGLVGLADGSGSLTLTANTNTGYVTVDGASVGQLYGSCSVTLTSEGNAELGFASPAANAVEITALEQMTDMWGTYILASDIVGDGITREFHGRLYGAGHTIYTQTVLFSQTDNAQFTVQDVNIVLTKTMTDRAVLVRAVYANNETIPVTFRNVHISAENGAVLIGSGDSAGALAGEVAHTQFINCTSSVTIDAGTCSRVGGLVGWTKMRYVSFTGCANTGAITAAAYANLGGIVGQAHANTNVFTSCLNAGSITALATGSNAGGITGYVPMVAEYYDCVNTGRISVAGFGGSVIGSVSGSGSAATLDGCTNSGTILVDYETDGFVGRVGTDATVTLTDCENSGVISIGGTVPEGTFTITYVGLGDATCANPSWYTEEDAASILLVDPSERSGYRFVGWYIGAECVTSLDGCTGDLVIRAKWVRTGAELPSIPA